MYDMPRKIKSLIESTMKQLINIVDTTAITLVHSSRKMNSKITRLSMSKGSAKSFKC